MRKNGIQPFVRLLWASLLTCAQVTPCLFAVTTHSAIKAPTMHLTLANETLTTTPIGKLFFSHFIELGFGRQVEGMWSEMLFNRSFEAVPPYRGIHWYWLQRSPKDDLSTEEWWHSGYEEEPWFKTPDNDQADWKLVEATGFRRGQWGGWLSNPHPSAWAGVAQAGIHVRKGGTYRFEGMLRAPCRMWDWGDPQRKGAPVELRIYRDHDWSKPLVVKQIDGLTGVFPAQPFTLDFTVENFEGRATFSLWTPPASELNMDDLSLKPTDNIDGWRREAIEAARRVRPALIRWPGGCFTSFYHWREGVGPSHERHPRESQFWGGLNENDVGTLEMLRFCELAGAESFICVNMLTGSVGEAADWVAYCNSPASHPLGKLRASHGRPEPSFVKYWELDNETGRRFGAIEYARLCIEYSRAMKAVDPRIKTVMIAYEPYRPHLREMLEIAGREIDYVTDRNNIEDQLQADLALLRAYNDRHGTSLRLTNTEWLAPTTDVPIKPDLINFQAATRDDTLQNRQIRWRYTMNVARQLLLFMRMGGELEWTNFNNFANTWGQNVIECTKEEVFLSATGLLYEMMARSGAAWPLRQLWQDKPDPELVCQAAWNGERDGLVLHLINYKPTAQPVAVNLEALPIQFSHAHGEVLIGKSLTAHLTPSAHDAIEHHELTTQIMPGRLLVELPPFSIAQIKGSSLN